MNARDPLYKTGFANTPNLAYFTKIVQMTPRRLRRESLRLQKFSVTNREPLRLQKFAVTSTVLSLPFSQQIQFTLIVNVVNLN